MFIKDLSTLRTSTCSLVHLLHESFVATLLTIYFIKPTLLLYTIPIPPIALASQSRLEGYGITPPYLALPAHQHLPYTYTLLMNRLLATAL